MWRGVDRRSWRKHTRGLAEMTAIALKHLLRTQYNTLESTESIMYSKIDKLTLSTLL